MTRITNSGPQARGDKGRKSSILQRTEDFRMSECDRRQAEDSLRDGERIAELISRSGEKLHSAAALVGNFFLHRAG